MWQTDRVAALLKNADAAAAVPTEEPETPKTETSNLRTVHRRPVSVKPVVVSTTGDRKADTPIHQMGGKGMFVKEVQAAVLDGQADIAVHSAKDLPSDTLDGLVLAAVLERGDARDALVGCRLSDLPEGAIVATGAVRRSSQLAWLRPDLVFAELRGNIATRLARLDQGPPINQATQNTAETHTPHIRPDTDTRPGKAGDRSCDAVVMAATALDRLGIEPEVLDVLDVDVMLPQAGQGAIAVECREDDHAVLALLAAIEHKPTRRAVDAERAFLAELGGDCNLPAGAHAVPTHPHTGSDSLELTGLLASLDGHVLLKETRRGSNPAALGRAVARCLLDSPDGESLLTRLRPSGSPADNTPDRPPVCTR